MSVESCCLSFCDWLVVLLRVESRGHSWAVEALACLLEAQSLTEALGRYT